MCNKIVTIKGIQYEAVISDSGSEFLRRLTTAKKGAENQTKSESSELFKDMGTMPGYIVCHSCGKITRNIDAPQKEEDVHNHAHQAKPSKAVTGGTFCACGNEVTTMIINFNWDGSPRMRLIDKSYAKTKHKALVMDKSETQFITEGLENDSRTLWDFFFKTIKGRGFAYSKAIHKALNGWASTAPKDLADLLDAVMFKTSALKNPSPTWRMFGDKKITKIDYKIARSNVHASAYEAKLIEVLIMDKYVKAYSVREDLKAKGRNARMAKFYLDLFMGDATVWTKSGAPAYQIVFGHSHTDSDVTSIANWKHEEFDFEKLYKKHLDRKMNTFINHQKKALKKDAYWDLRKRVETKVLAILNGECIEKGAADLYYRDAIAAIYQDHCDSKGSENPLECGYLDDADLWRTQFVTDTGSDDSVGELEIDSEVDMGSDGDEEYEVEEVLNLEYFVDSASYGEDDDGVMIMESITEVGMEIANQLGETVVLADGRRRHIKAKSVEVNN
jgi:hypothetical protein